MLKAQPAEARTLHEAHVITRAQLEALIAAGRLVAEGQNEAARARLAAIPTSAENDGTTELDVVVVGRARDLVVEVLLRAKRAEDASFFQALSLQPRAVSAQAEREFVRHALNLSLFIRADVLLDLEVETLRNAVQRLDTLQPIARANPEMEEEATRLELYTSELIQRVADRRFALSLETFTDIIDLVDRHARGEEAFGASEAFAFGWPLLDFDFNHPPEAQRKRATAERGAWDVRYEVSTRFEHTYGRWLAWNVVDDAESLEEACSIIGRLQAALAKVPSALRQEWVASDEDAYIPCEFAPLVTSPDWVSELDTRLAMLAKDLPRALAMGLVVISQLRPGTL